MTDVAVAYVLVALVIALAVIVALTFRTVQPFQVGVLVMLGSYRGTLNPGLHFISPLARVIRVDLRPRTESLAPFPAAAVDGSQLIVSARVDFRVVNATKFVFQVSDGVVAFVEAMRNSVTKEISLVQPATLNTAGWGLAERLKSDLSASVLPIGVEVGQLTLGIEGPAGMVEYSAGTRLT